MPGFFALIATVVVGVVVFVMFGIWSLPFLVPILLVLAFIALSGFTREARFNKSSPEPTGRPWPTHGEAEPTGTDS